MDSSHGLSGPSLTKQAIRRIIFHLNETFYLMGMFVGNVDMRDGEWHSKQSKNSLLFGSFSLPESFQMCSKYLNKITLPNK